MYVKKHGEHPEPTRALKIMQRKTTFPVYVKNPRVQRKT